MGLLLLWDGYSPHQRQSNSGASAFAVVTIDQADLAAMGAGNLLCQS
jgi:hypothetical protein